MRMVVHRFWKFGACFLPRIWRWMLERISRTSQKLGWCSEEIQIWQICPNIQGNFCSTWLLCCSRQFAIIDGRKPLLKRLVHRLMVVLLTIQVNCSYLKAKPAHMVGHLPPIFWFLCYTILALINTCSLYCLLTTDMWGGKNATWRITIWPL